VCSHLDHELAERVEEAHQPPPAAGALRLPALRRGPARPHRQHQLHRPPRPQPLGLPGPAAEDGITILLSLLLLNDYYYYYNHVYYVYYHSIVCMHAYIVKVVE
jgi:hypothetical protein